MATARHPRPKELEGVSIDHIMERAFDNANRDREASEQAEERIEHGLD